MPSLSAVQTLLLLPDPRGTPLSEMSAAGHERGVHTPYGHAEPLMAARTGFNGQLREGHGWYQLGNGHRVYNPRLMRFHSPDRLSPFEKGGLNAYAYCLGDPVNFTDPGGRFVAELPSLVMENLFETPIASAVHNSALLIGAVLLQRLVPATGPALVASIATMFGSGLGVAGSIMQFAGEKEEGLRLATVGTAISSIASTIRVSLTWDKIKEKAKTALSAKEPVVPAVTSAVPVPTPVVTDVPTHGTLIDAQQMARRGSASGVIETQKAVSFKQVTTVNDAPDIVSAVHQARKDSIFRSHVAAPYPTQKKFLRRLSRHDLLR